MNFLVILTSNLKRILKKKSFIIISFVIPLSISLIFGFVFNKGNNNTLGSTAIINSDKGPLGADLISELQKTNGVRIYTKEEGIEKLKKKLVSVCYEIPENFSELVKKGDKPVVAAHKIESSMETSDFEFNLNNAVNNMVLENDLKLNGVSTSVLTKGVPDAKIQVISSEKASMDDTIILNILISFVIFGAIGIAEELFSLKKQNILERSFATGNKPWKVIGGILGALFIFYSVVYSSVFLIESIVRGSVMLEKWPVVVVNMIFMVLVSLSLGIFASRVCKNENTINIFVQIISWITCFVGGSFAPLDLLPKTIQNFSKFTPQYWTLQSINTGNYALVLIVALFALVLFTAGTFKTRRFI